jgi:hypothetical protein
MNYYRLTEREEDEIEKRANRYQMKVHFMAQAVGITTSRGAWQLILTAPNNVKLMHENSKVKTFARQGHNSSYHNQHRNFPDFQQAIEYIYCHDSPRLIN